MYTYEPKTKQIASDQKQQPIQWENLLTSVEPLQLERILDKRLIKKTREKEYFEYLVKWKNLLVTYAT